MLLFQPTYNDLSDTELIEEALEGSSEALESLVKKHQHYIYNIALKMVLSPMEAEDLTQEILIKMVTKLSQFRGKSNFRTWLYRMTFNHFLNMKKKSLENTITSFEAYGNDLDNIPNAEMTEAERIEQKELIKEAKFSCMSGMLLCLNREQRLVYILGEIFEVDHNVGSELLSISKTNFRKRLERARRDLYQFMNSKCGLINKKNPCRCARKTTGFVKAGWVDKSQLRYNTHYLKTIYEQVNDKNTMLNKLLEENYHDFFQRLPFQEKAHHLQLMKRILGDEKVRTVFNLN